MIRLYGQFRRERREICSKLPVDNVALHLVDRRMKAIFWGCVAEGWLYLWSTLLFWYWILSTPGQDSWITVNYLLLGVATFFGMAAYSDYRMQELRVE